MHISFKTARTHDQPAAVTISLAGKGRQLRNLVTGQVLAGQAPPPIKTPFGPPRPQPPASEFHLIVQPHSFVAFAEE
jgi:hypothetical protein